MDDLPLGKYVKTKAGNAYLFPARLAGLTGDDVTTKEGSGEHDAVPFRILDPLQADIKVIIYPDLVRLKINFNFFLAPANGNNNIFILQQLIGQAILHRIEVKAQLH